MPPLVGKKWYNRLTDFIPPILGGHPDADNSEEAHAGDQAHESQSEAMNGGVAERASAGAGKRARDSREEVSLTNNKKLRMHNQNEGSLTGHYNDRMPGDAQKVSVPGPNDRMNNEIPAQATKAQANPMRSKPGSSYQHKTLNNIHANQPGRVSNSRPAFKPTTAKATVPPRTARNMARPAALNHDVGDSFGPSPSKRRRTNGAPETSNQQTPVEVLSDDDEVRILGVNGVSCSGDSNSAVDLRSQSQSQSQSSTIRFGATEQQSIDKNLDYRVPKSRRRNGHKSPSESSLAPSGAHPPARPMSSTQAQPGTIEDLGVPTLPHLMKSSPKVRDAKNNRLPHPSTTLGRGVVDDDFGHEDLQRRKDDHNVGKVSRGVSHLSGPSLQSAISKQERRTHRAVEQETPPRQPRPTQVLNTAEREQPLRTRFVRDEGITAPQQQQPRRHSVVSSMQVTSNSSKANIVPESPDQLQGENTVIHRRQMQHAPTRAVAGSPGSRHSPSDIPPTQFTASAKKPTRIPQRIPEKDDNVRISLDQILSRGCVLDTRVGEQYIDLVWQTENAAFVVERNGQPYCIPGTKEYMTIGNPEVSTWHSGNDSTQVVLKGSASENRSSGTILLYFVDTPGMNACWDWAEVASAGTLKTVAEVDGMIGKKYKTLAKDIELDARKRVDRLKKKAQATVAPAQRDLSRRVAQEQPATEHIIYEQSVERDERQPSTRSRMQDSGQQPSSQLTSSAYFTEGGNRVPRKSTRQSKAVIERTPSPPPAPPRWTETHELEPWHQPVMFPTTGARRTAVDFQDIERLDEGEFLNDNLVGYALRRIEEDMAPEHKSKVHFFNSYFFTSLTSKNGRKAFNYDAVKKWTKQKDLLNTPYIVVPINENLHWFVAIICNLPNLVRKSALLGDEAADTAETPAVSQRSSVQPSPIQDPDEIQDSQDPEKPDAQAMRQLSLDESENGTGTRDQIFEFDENKNLVGILSESHRDEESTQKNSKKSGKKSKKRAAPSLRKYPTDKPTIITLDSFGVGHPGQVATLKKYVEAEALDKRNMDAVGAGIQGMTAAGIPVQSNYCDCGLYLVGYVAEFAKDPEGFVNKVLTRQLDQEGDFASFDPSAKRAELRDDLLKLHEEQDQARIALKKAKKEEKLKDKVGATAVTAQTSATPAASKHPSPVPAPPQPSTKQSVKAPSPLEAMPTASRIPSEELGHLQHALGTQHDSHESTRVGSDPTFNATESSIHGTRDSSDASGDDELDEGPTTPFVPDASTNRSAVNARNSILKQATSLEGSIAEDGGDGEMLDGLDGTADAKEGNLMRDFAQRRNGHKVTSPGMDTLANILGEGPPSAKKQSPAKKES